MWAVWPSVSLGEVHPFGSNSNLLVVIILNSGDDLESAGLVSGAAGLDCPGNPGYAVQFARIVALA